MKYINYLIVIILVFLSFNSNCLASTYTYDRTAKDLLVPDKIKVDSSNLGDVLTTPAVSPSEKIYDYADLFSRDEEEYLYQVASEYINNSGIDLAIVTTNNLNKKSISKYAYNFYDYNDFKYEGIVFVISVVDGVSESFMGNSGNKAGKVFTIYDQVRIKQIIAYISDDINNGNFYRATDNYLKILNGFYNLDRNGNYRVNNNGNIVKKIPWFEIALLSFTLTFIIIVFSAYKLKTNKLKFSGYEKNLNPSTLMVRIASDELINSKISNK